MQQPVDGMCFRQILPAVRSLATLLEMNVTAHQTADSVVAFASLTLCPDTVF